jgi:hypothetical protein
MLVTSCLGTLGCSVELHVWSITLCNTSIRSWSLRTYLLLVQPMRLWRPHLLLEKPVRFTHATIVNSTCAFSQHLWVSPVRFTHATIANSTCAFLQHLWCTGPMHGCRKRTTLFIGLTVQTKNTIYRASLESRGVTLVQTGLHQWRVTPCMLHSF